MIITIRRKKDKEKLSTETIDEVKQKIISGFDTQDLKAANALLNELRQSYADTPHLLAETLSDIAQDCTHNKSKLALLEEAFKLNPDNPTILNRYGYALTKFKPKQVDKAFELFERAVKIEPDNVKTFYKYALALAKYAQAEKAFEMFERALQLEPNNYKALNSYAIALTHHGRAEKAFELFERSLQINANDTTALNSYGKALADKGEFQKAFELFERSLQVDANNPIALTSYGKALADKGEFQKAFDQFEKSLQIKPDNHITLFMYATVLEAAQRYEEAIYHIEKIRFDDLSPNDMNFIVLKLGQLCYLTKQEANGKKYFDWVIKNARDADVGRLQAAMHILAIQPYSHKAIDLLREIIETSPNHTQALRMLSLNLDPKGYFELFNTPTQDSTDKPLQDTEMLNRTLYHKIKNEVSILKEIAHEIIADTETQDEILSEIIRHIEMIFDGIQTRRHQEEAKVQQIPANDYEEIIAIIAQTAHDIVDFVNNELVIIQMDVDEALFDVTENEPRYQGLNELQAQLTVTQAALDDLKSVNEGLKIKNNYLQINALFETWQNNPKLRNATISLDIQEPESEWYLDKQKIKSFLSELIDNSLKHNANQADLKIQFTAQNNQTDEPRKKIRGHQKYLIITYRDNGKGISQSRKEWVFLPLKTTRSKDSSGLGLFMIKRTLKEMKGTIIEKGKGGVHFEMKIPDGELS